MFLCVLSTGSNREARGWRSAGRQRLVPPRTLLKSYSSRVRFQGTENHPRGDECSQTDGDRVRPDEVKALSAPCRGPVGDVAREYLQRRQ